MHPSFHNSGSRNKSFSLQVLVSCTVMRSVVFNCWNLYSHSQVSNWWDGLQYCQQKRTSPNILWVFRSEKYHNLLAENGREQGLWEQRNGLVRAWLKKGTYKPHLSLSALWQYLEQFYNGGLSDKESLSFLMNRKQNELNKYGRNWGMCFAFFPHQSHTLFPNICRKQKY
jgi:hypothetical protein